jgi:predicted transcriptional regulator
MKRCNVTNTYLVKRDARDSAVLNTMLRSEWISIADLCRNGFRVGTVRASLQRLLATGRLERQWEGNERYGRYVYRVRT